MNNTPANAFSFKHEKCAVALGVRAAVALAELLCGQRSARVLHALVTFAGRAG